MVAGDILYKVVAPARVHGLQQYRRSAECDVAVIVARNDGGNDDVRCWRAIFSG